MARTPLAVTMGEPAGIGPDLLLQLYSQRQEQNLPAFVVYGNVAFLRARVDRLGLSLAVAKATPETAVELFNTALPVIDMDGDCSDNPGLPSTDNAGLVIQAIERAVSDVIAGDCRALVTAPIHKAQLYAAGFRHPGHTEFLAALCASGKNTPHPVMMLAHQGYRVVPLTIHIPLKDVATSINQRLICKVTRIVAADLKKRFDIAHPNIAISGLNPHAGEDGTIGLEDRDIIAPAVATLKNEGIKATGPLAADTLFHPPHWQSFDCVIAMYHDQALIPIKTLAFDQGVNVTLGLPIVRTSPDHGTAFSLAGTGKASIGSMLAALLLADKMSTRS
jgi:4-hydroxythreonine-4-phosphate dehydrogenase